MAVTTPVVVPPPTVDAAQTLRASEARYRRLFEAARDGILILNAVTGEIAAVNPFLASLLGYSEAEILGKKLWELGPFEDAKKGKVAFKELQRQEYIRYDDLPLETKDGRTIDVEFVSNAYLSDQEQVIQCNIRDLTASKRGDRARQDSDQRYRSMFEYAPDGILIADQQGRYIDANRAMCVMLGYTREELVGLQSADIVMPFEVPHIAPALAAITTTPDYSREWEFRRQDRSSFCADVIGTEMPDGNLMAFVRDNTARNRANEAIRTADERMRFVLKSAGVGIWDMNYATGVLDWSDEAQAQYGIEPGTFGNTFESFIERVYPDDRAAVLAAVRDAGSAGSVF